MNKYYLHTTSISCQDFDVLNESLVNAKPSFYERIISHCPEFSEWEFGLGYGNDELGIPMIKQDPNISFYESTWNGNPCFIVRFYGIDNIFLEESNVIDFFSNVDPWLDQNASKQNHLHAATHIN